MKLFGTIALCVPVLAVSAVAALAKPIEFINATKVACSIQAPGLSLTLDPNTTQVVDYTHKPGTTVVATCKGGGYRNPDEQSTCLKPPEDNIEFGEIRMRPWQFGAFVCAAN